MKSKVAVLERNRANAQKSTGPRTPQGRRNSAQNARRLGLYVSDATLESEHADEFAELLAGYIKDYSPVKRVEEELVRQLAVSTLRLQRLDRIENALLSSHEIPETRHEANVLMKDSFFGTCWRMDTLLRARTQAERQFNRTYKLLEERVAHRAVERPIVTEVFIEPDSRHTPVPSPAAKRTVIAACATVNLQNEPTRPATRNPPASNSSPGADRQPLI